MVSIPKPAEPLKKYRVTITHPQGKGPASVSIEWTAVSSKEALRGARSFVLRGRYAVAEIEAEPVRPRPVLATRRAE